MRRSREIAIATAGLGALIVGALFASPARSPDDERAFTSSTFDAGPRGARAVYLLLEALGHRVERRTRPDTVIDGERIRVVLGAALPPDRTALAWVARGHTLVVAPPPRGIAAGERAHEAGRVIMLPSAEALENGALRRDGGPAVALAAICATRAYGGRVVFDESAETAGLGALLGALMKFPIGPLLLQLAIGLALYAWAGARRFGPPLHGAATGPAPAAAEQVAALSDLYERARAAAPAAAVLGAHFRLRATRALGLAPSTSDAALAESLCRRYGGAPLRLRELLAIAATPGPTPRDLARMARGLYDYEERMHGTRGGKR